MTATAPKPKPVVLSSCDDLAKSAYDSTLLQGAPKEGKTYTAISTCEGAKKEGEPEVVVINSDDKRGLQRLADDGWRFDQVYVSGNEPQRMFDAIGLVRAGIAAGKYKTVVWDTLSRYAWRVQQVYEDATRNVKGESDGRRFWPQYANHIFTVLDLLVGLDANVIVTTHWTEYFGKEIDGQAPRAGEGIVADLPGQVRTKVGAWFTNIVYLEVAQDGTRRFLWKPMGVFGPKGRTLPKDVTSCGADFRELRRVIAERREKA